MTLKQLSLYGKTFQLKVIKALLFDRAFILNVRDVLKEEYFDSDAHKWIIKQVIQYFDTYHNTISKDILKVEYQKVGNEVLRVDIKEQVRLITSMSEDDMEYIQEEFTNFCKNQEMKAAILSSAELLEGGDFDGIRSRIERAMKAGVDKNLGHEYKKDIDLRYREDTRRPIPFHIPQLTQLTQGGIGGGDLVIIFGNPGGAKSWTCIGLAANAVQLGYNVNYYTLELSEDYVGKRFDCYNSGLSIDKIVENRKLVEELVKDLPGNLIVKEYPPKGASIETIRSHIMKCTDMGFPPDLVVIDYIDYLKSSSKGGYSERKDEVDDVYIGAKGLAKEFKIPVVSPSQVNRMGAKDDVIEGDKAAGSYDKMMVADIAISMSRKKEDRINGTGRIHVMKNRYGEDGRTFEAKIDTSNGFIEITGEHGEESEEISTKKGNEKAKQALDRLFNS